MFFQVYIVFYREEMIWILLEKIIWILGKKYVQHFHLKFWVIALRGFLVKCLRLHIRYLITERNEMTPEHGLLNTEVYNNLTPKAIKYSSYLLILEERLFSCTYSKSKSSFVFENQAFFKCSYENKIVSIRFSYNSEPTWIPFWRLIW